MMYRDHISTPIGDMEITATDDAITSVRFVSKLAKAVPNDLTKITAQQLGEYFDGTRFSFDLPLAASGTSFQKAVWAELSKLEFGKTYSYQNIANALDNPKAVRAVGAANGRNPLTIIVPCHRVIGANGSLTGYAGGLDRKTWLLKHEGLLLF